MADADSLSCCVSCVLERGNANGGGGSRVIRAHQDPFGAIVCLSATTQGNSRHRRVCVTRSSLSVTCLYIWSTLVMAHPECRERESRTHVTTLLSMRWIGRLKMDLCLSGYSSSFPPTKRRQSSAPRPWPARPAASMSAASPSSTSNIPSSCHREIWGRYKEIWGDSASNIPSSCQ